MQKPSKPRNIRLILWQLAMVAVVLIAWRLIPLRQRPDLLPDPYLSPSLGLIHHGESFRLEDVLNVNVRRSAIFARPVTGGPERMIVQESPEVLYVDWLRVTDTDVLYQVQPRRAPYITGGVGGGRATIPHVFLGNFRPGKEKPLPEEKRTIYPGLHPNFYRLRRAPRMGGPAKDVPGVQANRNIQVVGDWVYWIKQGPDRRTSITHELEDRIETEGHSDLMATSLTSGETRKLTGDMIADTSLIPGAEGVYWLEPRAYPDPARDLYYSQATGTRTLAIPDFTGKGSRGIERLDFNADVITEYGGRLYWIECETSSEPGIGRLPMRIVSANPDGSDRKTVLDLRAAKLGTDGLLKAYHGNLYFAFYHVLPPEKYRKDLPIFLCRLHPDRKDPIEILHTIGFNKYFDDDYIYYRTTEDVRPLWAILMGDDMLQATYRSYRFRLPK